MIITFPLVHHAKIPLKDSVIIMLFYYDLIFRGLIYFNYMNHKLISQYP